MTLTPESLLAGAAATHVVEVPARLLGPDAESDTVTLKPLTVADVQRIAQAAKAQRVLSSALMVHHALVAPKLSVEQVMSLPAGLLEFLLAQTNHLSGLAVDPDDVEAAVRAPLTRACFLLGRAFGWTPAEFSQLTVGQVLLYLEMLGREERPPDLAADAAE